jgi:hypothetical protein
MYALGLVSINLVVLVEMLRYFYKVFKSDNSKRSRGRQVIFKKNDQLLPSSQPQAK